MIFADQADKGGFLNYIRAYPSNPRLSASNFRVFKQLLNEIFPSIFKFPD